jgi:hypothetical protein
MVLSFRAAEKGRFRSPTSSREPENWDRVSYVRIEFEQGVETGHKLIKNSAFGVECPIFEKGVDNCPWILMRTHHMPVLRAVFVNETSWRPRAALPDRGELVIFPPSKNLSKQFLLLF